MTTNATKINRLTTCDACWGAETYDRKTGKCTFCDRRGNRHPQKAVSDSVVKAACRHILSGDLDAARAELGTGYSVTVAQGRALAGSLREAARRYDAPHLATRSALSV